MSALLEGIELAEADVKCALKPLAPVTPPKPDMKMEEGEEDVDEGIGSKIKKGLGAAALAGTLAMNPGAAKADTQPNGIDQSTRSFLNEPRSDLGGFSRREFGVLNNALTLYIYAKQDNSPILKDVSDSLNRFISVYNSKEFVNMLYKTNARDLKDHPEFDSSRKKYVYENARQTVTELNQLVSEKEPEFK